MAVVNREIYQQFGIQETDGRLARRVQRDRIFLFFSTNFVHVISKNKLISTIFSQMIGHDLNFIRFFFNLNEVTYCPDL